MSVGIKNTSKNEQAEERVAFKWKQVQPRANCEGVKRKNIFYDQV